MFTNIGAHERVRRRQRTLQNRNSYTWKRPLVYAAADSVYYAVHMKRPQQEIDRLLQKLADTIRSRRVD